MQKTKTLVVMCNGPSLKEVDFKTLDGFDTFGMNGAYRYYYKTNWWPKYFSCFDRYVTDNHRESYKAMMENDIIPIERYFLLSKISESKKLTVLPLNGPLYTFRDSLEKFGNGGNTGANSCQVGICLGYKKIILLGADCNYVDLVDGAKHVDKNGKWWQLEMAKTPDSNPNYFFDDYQQAGDKYNLPQSKVFHEPAWESLAKYSKANGIDIVNCSLKSTLNCFRKSELQVEIAKAGD